MNLHVSCPYCDSKFDVPSPDKLGFTDDIKCVPYTRDIGRFDSKNDDEVFSISGWSRIGKDYLPIFNWEKIGILRLNSPGLNIQYRVQKCSNCKNLFDIYANYSKDKLKNIWTHLFGTKENNADIIKPYSGNSIITWLVRKLGAFFRNKVVGAIIFGAALLFLSFLPWQFYNSSKEISNVIALNFITKMIAAIGVVVVLVLGERYFSYLSNTKDFKNLFDIKGDNEFVHWRNYTLSRFIGVQKENKFPSLTQSDYVVGAIALVVLLLTWLITKFHLPGILIIITFLLALTIIGITYTLINKRVKNNKHRFLFKAIIGISVLLPVLIGAIKLFLKLDVSVRYDLISSLFDLLFWFICIYIFGNAIWVSMSTCTYIMKGISVIPLKISPFNRFANITPLRKLHSYSSGLMLSVFLTLTIILTSIIFYFQPEAIKNISSSYANPSWILYFLILVVGAIFIALGVGSNQFTFFYITAFYTSAIIFFKNISFSFYGYQVGTQVIITALFFTSLLIFQFYTNENIIKKLLTKKKKQAINSLSNRIEILRTEIFSTQTEKNRSNQKSAEYNASLEELEKLMSFVREIEELNFNPNYIKEILKFLAPVIISIATEQVVPKIIEKLVF